MKILAFFNTTFFLFLSAAYSNEINFECYDQKKDFIDIHFNLKTNYCILKQGEIKLNCTIFENENSYLVKSKIQQNDHLEIRINKYDKKWQGDFSIGSKQKTGGGQCLKVASKPSTEDPFVYGFMSTCVPTQLSMEANKGISEVTIKKYCRCVGNYLKDVVPNDTLMAIVSGKVHINTLKSVTEIAGNYCINQL